MADGPDPEATPGSAPDAPAVAIRVTRTGGIAGIRRGWRVESGEPDGWAGLVDACPWDEGAVPDGADRFTWCIEVHAPEPERRAEVPETAMRGPWRELVERVRDEGEPVRARRGGADA
ncbi:protealysin inhibitor emfourin [Protaetiibacter intestinalis]|uniref:Uncharacterized protein n=1 Tax=Protaetiibacter intestinalis TaxID=2419774 RepID=A0A387BDQ4_9MICO|nr:protealysin inhibitor emfourin [Protaetiibacter intestinalis]AYF99235.1 hypothetical protein D7I47_13860 [Protaetiibacter intestinalis]